MTRSSGSRPHPKLRRTGDSSLPGPTRSLWRWLEILGEVATLGLALMYIASLIERAAGARLQTDECFHAAMAEWIATHRTLPATIPELYSGFSYYYPPLFHILGALWIVAFGVPSFVHFNVFVTALLLVALWVGSRSLGKGAGRWAIALTAANAWVSLHALRLYVEQLTTLLVVVAFLLILRVDRAATRLSVAGLGVVTGLALVSKHSSLVLILILLGLVAVEAVRRERTRALAYATAAGIGLLVAAPMFVRNLVLYGSPVYPALAPDLHPLLYQLNRSRFTLEAGAFYRQTAEYAGPAIGLMVLAALAIAVIGRKVSTEIALLGACLALYAAAPLQPLLDPRHMLPVIVGAAVMSSIVVARHLEGRAAVRMAIGAVLLVLAAHAVLRMPRFREFLDAPAEMIEAYRAVRTHVPEDEPVLSLWTYDTFYYSRRPATWPIPWGQKEHPVEMFLTSNCDSVLLALRRHRLRYVLLSRMNEGESFDAANYPLSFNRCVTRLLDERRLEVLWSSPAVGLVRVTDP